MSQPDPAPKRADDLLLCHPERLQLDDGIKSRPVAERRADWEIMRPIDLSRTHGHEITLERLQEIAAAYDAGIEMASINFDHKWGGPSHGRIESVRLSGNVLVATVTHLSDELIDAVQAGKYYRQSAEILFQHPVTRGWYLTGLAVLGNSPAAIRGLRPIRLAHQPTTEESTMPNPNGGGEPQADPQDTDLNAQLKAREAALALAEQKLERIELRQRQLALETARAEAKLKLAKVPGLNLGARRLLEPLVAELMAADTPMELKLSATEGQAERTVNAADLLLEALAAMPDLSKLTGGKGELADNTGGDRLVGDNRSDAERQFHLSQGIDDERYAALRDKYRPGQEPAN